MLRTLVALVLASLLAAAADLNPFFAFDNGTGRDAKVPYSQQAEMLRKAGYAGIGFTGTQNIPEMLKELDARGLKMFSTYVAARIDPDKPPYDPGLPQAMKQLKGRDTAIWLTVQGKAEDGDARAVTVLREIADMAAENGLQVVIYPHAGFHVERTDHALELRNRAGRSNVGVSFNLAHFLAVEDHATLDARLKAAAPHLKLVSINGADVGSDWRRDGFSRFIQTLDRGAWDVTELVRKLRKLGYRGPIGLQAYQVPGEIEDNLQRSMAAWRRIDKAAR